MKDQYKCTSLNNSYCKVANLPNSCDYLKIVCFSVFKCTLYNNFV